MTLFFFIIIGFAFFCFIYEGILAPSMRLRLRCQVFEQRDKLRALKIEHPVELDEDTFKYLQDSLNNAIRVLPFVSISMLVETELRFSSDPSLRKRMAKRRQLLEDCPLDEAREIWRETNNTVRLALAVNSLVLSFSFVPLVMLGICIGKVAGAVRDILLVPANEAERMFTFSPDASAQLA